MWKELLIVGGAAAVGAWVVDKYGNQIQAKATSMGVPPVAAHILIVGGSAAGGYALLKAIF